MKFIGDGEFRFFKRLLRIFSVKISKKLCHAMKTLFFTNGDGEYPQLSVG